MIFLLALLFQAQATTTDCVDCIAGLEGIPNVSSIAQAQCSDCECYERTHREAMVELASSRATQIRTLTADSIRIGANALVAKMAEIDQSMNRLQAWNTSNTQALAESCNLNQLKTSLNGCQNDQVFQEIFGSSNVDQIVGGFADKFKSMGSAERFEGSCLTKSQLNELRSNKRIMSKLRDQLPILKEKKEEILSKIRANSLREDENLSAILADLSSVFQLQPIFNTNDTTALKAFMERIDAFEQAPGDALDFVLTGVYEQFPAMKEQLVAPLMHSCETFIQSVTSIACGGDNLAFTNSPPVVADRLRYVASDHANGFDSLFVNDDGLEFEVTNYVTHIFQCTGDVCQNARRKPDVCQRLTNLNSINSGMNALLSEAHNDEISTRNLEQSKINALCSMASCNGNETQMNACYERVRGDLGEDADSILLSFSRLSRPRESNAQSQTQVQTPAAPAPLFPPIVIEQSEFSRNFLGDYADPAPAATPAAMAANTQTTADTPAQTSQGSNGSSTRVVREPVVTASDAFSRFMGDRFQNLASQASSYPRSTPSRAPTVSSSGSNTVDRRVEEIRSRALQTIQDMSDDYERSSFQRMNQIVSNIAERNRNLQNQIRDTSNAVASNGGGSSRSQTRRDFVANPTNAFAATGASVVPTSAGSGSVATTPNQEQATNGRSIASVAGTSATSGNAREVSSVNGTQTLSVPLSELPNINERSARSDGLDLNRPFQLAVRVNRQVYYVPVRETVIRGSRMLEPQLDGLTPTLRAEVLKSPLFREYKQYLMNELARS